MSDKHAHLESNDTVKELNNHLAIVLSDESELKKRCGQRKPHTAEPHLFQLRNMSNGNCVTSRLFTRRGDRRQL